MTIFIGRETKRHIFQRKSTKKIAKVSPSNINYSFRIKNHSTTTTTTTHNSTLRQTTRCSRSCQSRRSAPAVLRQSSAPAGWSSTLSVVTGSATMFVGRHVCCAVWVLRHCILTLPFVALVSGHPRPSVVTGPVYRWCPCQDPLK